MCLSSILSILVLWYLIYLWVAQYSNIKDTFNSRYCFLDWDAVQALLHTFRRHQIGTVYCACIFEHKIKSCY